ncbi:hypothetical protein D3C80_1628400 [compost metagenome]
MYNQPWIPTSATQIGAIPSTYIDSQGVWTGKINANSIVAGSMSADNINGGTITSSGINVSTDITVGNNIILKGGIGNRAIWFNGSRGAIHFNYDWDQFEIGAMNGLSVPTGVIRIGSELVATREWVLANSIAKFA